MGPHPFTAARVVRVIDSITIDVEIDGQVFRVRYLGVQVSDTPVLGADGASISERALQFNRFHLQSGLVELERDIMDTDTSDRLLRYVYVNGEMVNKALLTNGYATVASFPWGGRGGCRGGSLHNPWRFPTARHPRGWHQ